MARKRNPGGPMVRKGTADTPRRITPTESRMQTDALSHRLQRKVKILEAQVGAERSGKAAQARKRVAKYLPSNHPRAR